MRFFLTMLLLCALLGAGCNTDPEETQAPTPSPTRIVAPEAAPLLNRAMHALDRQAYMTALAWADSAEQVVPGLAETAFVRGRIYFALGRREDARTAYEQVLSQDDTYEGAWLNFGNVAFQQKQYTEALQAYKRERSLHPAPTSWHAMGGAYEALGHPDSARWAYEQALATDSSYAPAHTSLAHWHESEGAFEEALRYARHALALQPDHLGAQYTAGALLFRIGRHEEAVDHLRPIVEEQPWNYSALFTLGQALQRMGQQEVAARYLERAETVRAEQAQVERLQRTAQERPGDFALQIETANALRRTGRLPEALASYHLAESLRPGNLSLQNNIATIYLQQNDTTEALTRYHRILRQDSTFAETWLNLGLHYARDGRQDAARASWDKARRYGPDNPAVKAFFARIEKQ